VWLKRGWATFFIGVAVATFTLFWCMRRGSLPVAHPTPASGRAASSPRKSLEPAPASSFSAPEAPAPILAVRTAAGLDTAPDELPAPSVVPTSIPVRVRRFAPSQAKKAAPVASHCAVPFVVDARGVKRVRPECY
jgi:hypothetical protein